jgi:hydrogenase nickel incorporation protein HypB
MILSVPEGHDKPLKYPKMFTKVDVLIISKIDAVSFFNFDFKKVTEYAKKLNPNIEIFPVSAKTGENMDVWIEYIKNQILQWRS